MITFNCPHCGARCKSADRAAGCKLPCPGCKRSIAVPSSLKPCPFCAEPVQPDAKKCRHCGEVLDPALRESRRHDPSRTSVVVNAPRKEFPHLIHLVLTFTTCGAWLPVYLLHLLIDSCRR